MCSKPRFPKTLERDMLERLYAIKCSQIKRAEATENLLMYALYKAEAQLLRSELDKF